MFSINTRKRKVIKSLKGTDIGEISNSLNDFLNDVDYFRFLVKKHELVDKNIVRYYSSDILIENSNAMTELSKSNLGPELNNREAFIRLLLHNGDFFKRYAERWAKG
jgi:hypothetical protein